MKKTNILAVLGLSLALASCTESLSSSSQSSEPEESSSSSIISSSSETETETMSSSSSSSSGSPSSSQTTNETEVRQYPGYHLIWNDEFNGESLDMGKWGYQVGTGDWGWGNGELQYYTEGDNAQVKDGNLIITARKEDKENSHYTSTRLWSSGKFSFKYGRVEARISLPTQIGMWPAFWMMPQDSVYGGWPYSGEIDIMERLLNQDAVNSTGNSVLRTSAAVHYANVNGNHTYWTRNSTASDSVRNYHLYTCVWDEESITMLVDDKQFLKVTKDSWGQYASYQQGGTPTGAPFDQNFYIILNLAVGGQAATPLASFSSDQMKVDYVRVYQLDE